MVSKEAITCRQETFSGDLAEANVDLQLALI